MGNRHFTDEYGDAGLIRNAPSGVLYGSSGEIVSSKDLGAGLLRNTVTTGVPTIAVRGTDFDLPYDAEQYYKKLAASRLGVSAKNLLFLWFPFYAIGVGGRSAITSGSGVDSILAQGWHLETGTTNSSYRSYAFNFGTFGATTAQKNLIAGAGKKWWSCTRMALSGNSWSSGEYAGAVGSDIVTANRLIVGVHGATSTTKFAAYSDTAALTSTVDLDTAERVHEAWRDGSTGNYAIDEGTAVQGDLRPTVDCAMIAIQVANASSGNHNRGVDIFWSAFATIKGG